ncbi:MAG TPA: TetR family transcriptional regulator [Kineosporiaceae bacterium]|nr:TetR family transcriptional regulator [Kineosporiaceae bacterium]
MTSLPAPAEGPEQPRRRGRRPAGEDRRGDILAAAREEFARRGFDGATLRGIARAAGVDPRLVHHYFEGKDDVFTAAFELPVRPQDVVDPVLAPGPDGIGERLVRLFLSVWDSPPGRQRIVALLSASLTSEAGARMLREFLTREVFARIVAALRADDPELRASLAASQMMGLVVARYVVALEPLASLEPDDVVEVIGPTLQTYLAGPLRTAR